MGTYAPTTTGRTNFRGGKKNTGSHLIGWDSGKVRSERYTFRTGQWPASKISFHYDTSVYDGKNIAIRCAISTSSTANVNKSGSSGGYAVKKNGTTTITISLKANTTYYIVFYPGVSKSSYGLLRADSNFKITQTTIDRGPCTAPTSLILSRTVQIPGEPVELSWSGAAGGTNTQIASYEIFYSTNRDAPDSDWTSAGSTVDASTTFNVITPAQEVTYYYKVKTKSNPAGYDSHLSIASEGLIGNKKPEVPVIRSVSSIKVPSVGGPVTFVVAAGQVSSGTATVCYSVDGGDTKTQFDGNLTITVNQVTTFSFYTYDGTDFSDGVSQTIAVNDKPQITNVGYTTINTYTALGGDGVSGSQLGYASEVKPTISPSESGKINVILEYYSSDNTDAWSSEATITSVPLIENLDIISAPTVELSTCHIHKGISLGNENIHWRLKFILNDGIEDSDAVYFPNNNGVYEDKYYAIAHAPSLQHKYNQFSNSDIAGTISGQIGNKIRLVAYKDTSMTGNVEVIASTGANTITVESVVSSYDNSYHYIDITLDNTKFKGGEIVSIIAKLTDSDGCLKKTITGIGNVTKTKIPSLPSALDNGLKTIKPFTTASTSNVSVVWPFGDYESLAAALEAYNCAATGAINLVYSNDTNRTNVIVKDNLTWSKNSDKLETAVNGATIYTWDGALGYDVYAGKHKYYCRIEITNLFGEIYATPWLNDDKDVFDFDEKAQNLAIQKIEWWKESESESAWVELGSTSDPSQTIQKGMKLRFTCYFKLYTTDKVIVSILVRSDSLNERDPKFYDVAKGEQLLTPITYTSQELYRADSENPRTPGENTRQYILTVNTDITTADIRHWRLKITNNGGEIVSSDKNTNVRRQCPPTINFTTCKVAKDYIITYYFEVDDDGGGTCTYYLSDQTDDVDLPGPPSEPTPTQNPFPYDPSNPWESKNIYIKVSSTVTGLITNTEIYYSKPILAYQVTPTVAYRPNTLGVNVENPDSSAMVDIHQSTGKTVVLVQGRDLNSNPTKFIMNPTTGQIGFYSYDSQTQTYVLEHALDLKTGQIITP